MSLPLGCPTGRVLLARHSISSLPRLLALLMAGLMGLLSACSLPQVSAEDRIFLGLSLNYQGAYVLPAAVQQAVGSLTALTYDRQQDCFYGLSQAASGPQLRTLKFKNLAQPSDLQVELVSQGELTTTDDQPWDEISATGLATNSTHLYLVGRRDRADAVVPLIAEVNATTGQLDQSLVVPPYFLPSTAADHSPQGIDPEAGLTAVAINPEGDRLFTATSRPLLQDTGAPSDRLLHYWIGEPEPIFIAQHRYPLETATNRLVGLTTVDSGGHFLALEESASPAEDWQIFQIATGGATDISRVQALQGDLRNLIPVQKHLLFSFSQASLPELQHVQSMTLGGYSSQGGQNLLVLANGRDSQMMLLFQLVATR